jgi:putative membrane protein
MPNFLILCLKGLAMGAANVVPGVSGGTIALITNIYQEFIHSLKSFNANSLKLLLKGHFKELYQQLNIKFLLPIFLGIVFSIISLAKLFDYLLVHFPSHTWAYFFGLVLASIYPIGKKIKNWNGIIILFFAIGITIAFTLSFLSPSPTENTSILYIFLCGVIGICGMILPGLSGSYILMLMGNYHLLMVKSINSISLFIIALLNGEWTTFIKGPNGELLFYFIIFLLGSLIGIILFSNLIAWVFNKYHDQTLSLLTGFVFGSLSIIWPWKKEQYHIDILDRHGKPLLIGYERFIPKEWGITEIGVIGFMIVGVITIVLVEYLAHDKS